MYGKNNQAVAVWLVMNATWSDTQRSALADALSIIVDKAMKGRRPDGAAARWFGSAMMLSLVICLVSILLSPSYRSYEGVVGYWIGVVALSALLSVSIPLSNWTDNSLSMRLCPIIEALGHVGQPTNIATVATGLMYRRPQIQLAAASALAKLSSRLCPDVYGTLPGNMVPALCNALLRADYESMSVILNALTLIGDARAIKAVERLAMKPPSAEIGGAASELLPILQQRELASQSSTQLLRASENKAGGQQELLRAVSRVHADEPALLVRAAGVEHE